MMHNAKRLIPGLFLSVALAAGASAEDLIQSLSEKLVSDYGEGVVHVTAVVEITTETSGGGDEDMMMGMDDSYEEVNEALATIIDPSGLAVCSEAALNIAVQMGEMEIPSEGGGSPIVLSARGELSEVQYRLADGTKIPARIVFQDENLDLAFIAPESELDAETKAKFKVVPLTNPAARTQLMSPYISLKRSPKALNYQTVVSTDRIGAVIERPRLFYLGGSTPGAPAFDMTGALLGVCAFHRASYRSIEDEMAVVIIPTEDVSELAEQARKEQVKEEGAEEDPS